jgi:hypothetical protein
MFDEESRLRRRRRKWRGGWIANFAERQRIAKRWIAFVNLADWCARSTTAAGIDEEERARDLAFRRLADSILKGEFERESRSQILYLDPRVMGDGASPRCRLTREKAEIAFALPPAASLSLTVLGCCWLPRELARHWLESHGYRWCPNFEPAPSPADAHTGESDSTRKPTGNSRRARPGPIPTADRIETAARELLAAGHVPAQTITWEQFRTELCKKLNVKPEQRGYSLDTIQDAVRPLLSAAQVTEGTESTEN